MRHRLSTLMPAMLRALLILLVLLAVPAKAEDDPLEAFNREIFAFNNKIDQMILRPVTVAYVDNAPEPVQTGMSNVLNNFRDVTSAVNALLQFRLLDAASSTSRVLINTTLGVGGIMDPASNFGIERRYADFGQTLASWGVPEGPFIMLPLLGPSTFRAGAGTAVDAMSLSVQAQLDTPGRIGQPPRSTHGRSCSVSTVCSRGTSIFSCARPTCRIVVRSMGILHRATTLAASTRTFMNSTS